MLEVKNLSAGYGKKSVISDISCTFNKGELTAVIGPNGSGKTTLLKSLCKIIEPKNGKIFSDSRDITEIKKSEYAKQISYLPQGKNVPDMTVFQMVIHGRFPYLSYPRRYSENDRKIAREAIRVLGLENYSGRMLKSLSGGERQKAYIAMLLTQDTPYILLDEPTAYLDISNQFSLMETLNELKENGKGVVCVLHELSLAFRYADKIIVIDNGRIVFSGTPDELYITDTIKNLFNISLSREKTENGYCYFYKKI